MNSRGDFATSDIHLASYLLATDHPLRQLDGGPGHRVFIFGDVAADEVTAFYAGVKVDARKLLGAMRDLKGLLAQGLRR